MDPRAILLTPALEVAYHRRRVIAIAKSFILFWNRDYYAWASDDPRDRYALMNASLFGVTSLLRWRRSSLFNNSFQQQQSNPAPNSLFFFSLEQPALTKTVVNTPFS